MVPGSSSLLAHELLQGFLAPHAPARSRLERLLPSSGTLPGITRLGGHHPLAHTLVAWLRSCGQVIFINNPLSGLLLLLAMALQSFWAAGLSLLGIAVAHFVARVSGADRQARRNGIYGFNGALVGSGVAALADLTPAAGPWLWLLLVLLGAGLTTLLVQRLGGWLVRHFALPPLTLPFCLVTWLLLLLASALAHPGLPLAAAAPPPPEVSGPLLALVQALPRGFGQVFFLPGALSGTLAVVAVAVASPLAALVGLVGGLVGGATGLLIGAPAAAVAQGLWSYNGVLTAIAVAGIFYPLTRRSLLAGLAAAACSSLLNVPLAGLLQRLTGTPLPLLTLPFIVATLLTLLVLRRTQPALIPVGLHSILTPEEHRRRFDVARRLMADFRRQLRGSLAGDRYPSLLAQAEPALVVELEELFASLDRDQDGRLSVAELAAGLGAGAGAGVQRDALAAVLAAIDLDGDGRVDVVEFSELMLRLRRLRDGEERLLHYLLPIDGDGDDRLDPGELNRLLGSVGQAPLEPREQRHLFGEQLGAGLSWKQFIDRLLLI